MDPDSCSDVIFYLFTVFVCSLAPENDNITLISRLCKDNFGKNSLFSLIFAVKAASLDDHPKGLTQRAAKR